MHVSCKNPRGMASVLAVLAILVVVFLLRRSRTRDVPRERRAPPPRVTHSPAPPPEQPEVATLPAMLTHWAELPDGDPLPAVPREASAQTQSRMQLRVDAPATIAILSTTGQWRRGPEGSGRSDFFTEEEEDTFALVVVTPHENRQLTLVDGSNTTLLQTPAAAVLDWPLLVPQWRPLLGWRRALAPADEGADPSWAPVESPALKMTKHPTSGHLELVIPDVDVAPLPSMILACSLRIKEARSQLLLALHGWTTLPGVQGAVQPACVCAHTALVPWCSARTRRVVWCCAWTATGRPPESRPPNPSWSEATWTGSSSPTDRRGTRSCTVPGCRGTTRRNPSVSL